MSAVNVVAKLYALKDCLGKLASDDAAFVTRAAAQIESGQGLLHIRYCEPWTWLSPANLEKSRMFTRSV